MITTIAKHDQHAFARVEIRRVLAQGQSLRCRSSCSRFVDRTGNALHLVTGPVRGAGPVSHQLAELAQHNLLSTGAVQAHGQARQRRARRRSRTRAIGSADGQREARTATSIAYERLRRRGGLGGRVAGCARNGVARLFVPRVDDDVQGDAAAELRMVPTKQQRRLTSSGEREGATAETTGCQSMRIEAITCGRGPSQRGSRKDSRVVRDSGSIDA